MSDIIVNGVDTNTTEPKKEADIKNETLINVTGVFTQEHRDYINRKIMKALKDIDWDGLVSEFMENLFETMSTDEITTEIFSGLMLNMIGGILVKKGLLKEADLPADDNVDDVEDENGDD